MSKPSPTSYPGYFQRYIDLVTEDDLFLGFKNQLPVIQALLASIPEEKGTYAYAVGKWTLKELLQHIIDAERIFTYRALCFARGEQQSQPGFEENEYAANSYADNRTWPSLVEEFLVVRHSTELLFKSFSKKALTSSGIANNNPASVESIGFIILGHLNHHMNIIKERYL
jgi:hypothetical protein